jgi:DNA-binding NtrC family response regulator
MTDSGRRKVLVVDDEATVGKSIRKALEREGYDIDIALSGEDALKMQEGKGYDVMLVDLMMPGMSGLDLLKSVKAAYPALQVIMITGYPTLKNTLQAMQIGAFDFLPKPFQPADLRSLVAKALETPPAGGGPSGASG